MEYLQNPNIVKSIKSDLKGLMEKKCGILIGRIGNSEMAGIKYAERDGMFSRGTIRVLRIGPGVYSKDHTNDQKEAESWCNLYMKAINICDAVTTPIIYFKKNKKIYPPGCKLFDVEALDPELLLPLFTGLKVLVVSPFAKTIATQFKIKDKLFDFKYPEFELKIVKSFFSTSNNEPHSGWTETFNVLSGAIQKEEFDVAILGCGSYGMPLAGVIKKMGKIAICTGGFTVAYFGIKYKRLIEQNKAHGWFDYILNENWIFPLEEEKPKSYLSIEDGCYF